MAKLLDGITSSKKIKNYIKYMIDNDFKKGSMPPTLEVILCSSDPASGLYVEKKQAACKEVGIESFVRYPLGRDFDHSENPMDSILKCIDEANDNPNVHGILVQLPLPASLDTQKVIDRICPFKDVDAFCPSNVGLLLQGRPRFVPCTPAGIQRLFIDNEISLDGKKVTIINRSNIVGKPLHALLSQDNEHANATCTLCHDHTPPELLKEICLDSDIIIVAVGIPGFLTEDMVSNGSIVVDVGINRLTNSKKIVGDCEFELVSKKCEWITPVPGGVGPMTVAMLLNNTYEAKQNMWKKYCTK